MREAGASVRLISDGDVAGVIHTADPEGTGIDIYLGIGGAPEGVLAAAALRCIGGQMQGRLVTASAEQKQRARQDGHHDFNKKFSLDDMASGDVMFAATGVTDGSLLRGVRFDKEHITTETVVMRSATGTVRWIKNRRRADLRSEARQLHRKIEYLIGGEAHGGIGGETLAAATSRRCEIDRAVRRAVHLGAGDARGAQEVADAPGDRGCRIDIGYGPRRHRADLIEQQRIMGAAQHDDIGECDRRACGKPARSRCAVPPCRRSGP